MTDKQVQKLKDLMNQWRFSQAKDREEAAISVFAYLDGCLDGITRPNTEQ